MDENSKKSEEFITSYFNWLTPDEQKEKAIELNKMTDKNKNKKQEE